MDKKYYLFDLDGTLTASGEGILNSARYALNKMEYPIPEQKILQKFIGPPLMDAFMSHCAMTKEVAAEAVFHYRTYFKEKGIFENSLYDGVKELLHDMQKAGKKIILCTSKPEVFSVQILKHYEIDKYFHFVAGAIMDGVRSKKTEIIAHILDTLKIPAKDSVMIGDTEFDILGAKQFSLTSVGVLYGYGSREGHEKAGADYIVKSVSELYDLIFN